MDDSNAPCTVLFMRGQTRKYLAELLESKSKLAKLHQQNPTHTAEYFQGQWDRQRALQLKGMSVEAKEKREWLGVLLQLEEELLEARQVNVPHRQIRRIKKLVAMNAVNAAIRTAEQRHELLDLPASLVALEVQIQAVADKLGNAELLNARRGTSVRVKAILSVQVALGFLYEAAVDVIQQKADADIRTGATQQPRNEQLRKKKRVLLKKKLETYLRQASKYNRHHRPTPRLLEPTLDEVLAMDLLDPFWDEVALDHLKEPWASCERTKEGIVAFRNKVACEEELQRLGREVRQLMGWALDYQARVDRTRPNEAFGGVRVPEWKSIHSGLSKRTIRLWAHWDRGLRDVVESTKDYVYGRVEADDALLLGWQQMRARTSGSAIDIGMLPIRWEPIDADEEAEYRRVIELEEDEGNHLDWELALA
ncbi:uncharacterized protein MELLADRAFT_68613 [Melampsora larici-populina 98AG31]|uniref:Uncharacterized protein n=1 Tax=Melampsora larici-populina (strain 98AG31 / pathotype 3-4-7) TaxID=747676 RepID=F4S7F7_MELLP|nr:uncharacterized protein MELLADRAFT_68613 [Melampsora larici-populina 98AG31]EGF99401.1 hypothetical protein MELLADRAFT_68613 [Melampsora larici-populina 98AG31]